jgi:hypothetical protein
MLNIYSPDAIVQSIKMYDVLGKLVMTSADLQGIEHLDLNELMTGIYILKMETDKGSVTKRISLDR